jgi:hypothetical protein
MRFLSSRRSVFQMMLLGLSVFPACVQGAPIDEFRISGIEQQIRDLQSAVREQARQIAELQQRNMGSNNVPNVSPTTNTVTSGGEQRWLSAANWQKLAPGMSELKVIELLGAPTQIRNDTDGSRQLLYAMEIGRSGFLSGKVITQNGVVRNIELPSLR